MIVLLLLAFFTILAFHAPKMLVRKQFWDFAVFLGLWAFALLVALLQVLNVKLPNPLDPVIQLIKPLTRG